MSSRFITEIEVILIEGKKRWVIKKNDYYPDTIGDITTGPYRATEVGLGTKYTTELIIEEIEV